MANACFIDTNVMLYLNDSRDPQKQATARRWINALAAHDRIVISPQVMNEFAYNVLRKFPEVTQAQLQRFLMAMAPWCKATVTAQTSLDALAVHARYRFSFFDSTMIAAALTYGCDVFITEDLASGQRIGDLTIVNPFSTAIEAVLTN